MLLTEKEAKYRGCCQPLVYDEVGRDTTYARIPCAGKCIASRCMAWRWGYTPEEAKGNKNGPLGFCGLAGRPE